MRVGFLFADFGCGDRDGRLRFPNNMLRRINLSSWFDRWCNTRYPEPAFQVIESSSQPGQIGPKARDFEVQMVSRGVHRISLVSIR